MLRPREAGGTSLSALDDHRQFPAGSLFAKRCSLRLCSDPEERLSALQDTIDERFLKALAESNDVDAHVIAQLRALLADRARTKADSLVKIFTSLPEAEVK